jgi:hypothetical protein
LIPQPGPLGEATSHEEVGWLMFLDRLLKVSGPVAVASGLLLAGCNQTSSPATMAPVAQAGAAAPMPGGTGCASQIGRFRTVIENENRVGQVNASVYKQVVAEVSRAEVACSAGKDAEAQRMLAATKARHGYPA